MKTLNEIDYDLELERIVKEIKKSKAKRVLIQLPDGLKPYATQIINELEKKTAGNSKGKNKSGKPAKAKFIIWIGSCFGACDVPIAEAEKLGVDLIVQFGHSPWKFKGKDAHVL